MHCAICQKQYESFHSLSTHISAVHGISKEAYYVQYLSASRGNAANHCLHPDCSQGTLFKNIKDGYQLYCSKSCKVRHQYLMKPELRQVASQTMATTMRRLNGEVEFVQRKQRRNYEFRKQHDGFTPYEWLLWQHPQFQQLKPVAQDRRFKTKHFGPTIDFTLPDYQVCVEVDGPGHNRLRDAERDQRLLIHHGWRTIRVTNREVVENIQAIITRLYQFIGREV